MSRLSLSEKKMVLGSYKYEFRLVCAYTDACSLSLLPGPSISRQLSKTEGTYYESSQLCNFLSEA